MPKVSDAIKELQGIPKRFELTPDEAWTAYSLSLCAYAPTDAAVLCCEALRSDELKKLKKKSSARHKKIGLGTHRTG